MRKLWFMKLLLTIFPVVLLVAYSQLIVKWRFNKFGITTDHGQSLFGQLVSILSDPFILSGYVAALLGSFIWLIVVSRLPLAIAFPIYIGLTFALVVTGSVLILGEPMTTMKLVGITLILAGIVIGIR